MCKSVLIHSIAFSPDGVSTAYLYNDIALKFKAEGFRVTVLTTTPHYNVVSEGLKKQPLRRRWGGLYFTSRYAGIPVYHVPQKKFKSAVLRIVGFFYWHIVAIVLGLSFPKIDVIISPSPPLSIGLVNLVLGWIKRAKVIYNVQEIYPDFLINQGKLSSGLAIEILKKLESIVYNKSHAVTTIDEIFYNTIRPRFNDDSKLRVIPNFVDTDLYAPLGQSDIILDQLYFPRKDGILKLMYAGNIGHAQDWIPLFEVAKLLQHKKVPAEFWVIGEGVLRSHVKEEIKNLNLKNVHLVPYQPREQMPSLIAYADLHFIFMSPEMDGQGFPSKVYTILACGKPLLVLSSKGTPINNFLAPIGAAYLVEENSLKGKVENIFSIIEDVIRNDNLKEMGKRGLKLIKDEYSKEAITKQYISLVHNLLMDNGQKV